MFGLMKISSLPLSNLALRIFMFCILALISANAHARDAKENVRIDHMIGSVESLKGAVFIRNGKEYEPKAAASHLRMKLEKAGDRVKTAKDFIDGLASNSSFSGKPYKIRKADGTLVTASAFFRARLKEYDEAHP